MKLGNITVTNEDNMEMMSRYSDNYFDLAIVDPPYGGSDAINPKSSERVKLAKRKIYKEFDNTAPLVEYFEELKRVSKNQIIWGVNFYKNFDFSGGRLCWDKKGTVFGRAELAYLSMTKSVNVFEYTWNGMLQENMKEKQIRIHPTEKPIKLYEWLLTHYAKENDKILDTHFGSLSIGIACHNLKYELTACELDKDYFEAGVDRLKNHQKQLTLF